MMLSRSRGATGALLTATGRDIAEAEYSLTFDGGRGQWTVAGSAAEVPLGDNSRLIISILKKHAGQSFKVQEVFDLLNGEIPLKSLKTQLYRLAKRGCITRDNGAFFYM